jgi:hypothetical protein
VPKIEPSITEAYSSTECVANVDSGIRSCALHAQLHFRLLPLHGEVLGDTTVAAAMLDRLPCTAPWSSTTTATPTAYETTTPDLKLPQSHHRHPATTNSESHSQVSTFTNHL